MFFVYVSEETKHDQVCLLCLVHRHQNIPFPQPLSQSSPIRSSTTTPRCESSASRRMCTTALLSQLQPVGVSTAKDNESPGDTTPTACARARHPRLHLPLILHPCRRKSITHTAPCDSALRLPSAKAVGVRCLDVRTDISRTSTPGDQRSRCTRFFHFHRERGG